MTEPGPAKRRRTPWAQILVPCLLAAVLALAYFFYVYRTQTKLEEAEAGKSLKELARQIRKDETLAAKFTDNDGDKLADPPAGGWLDPAELYFCFIASDDPDESEKLWQPLIDHLSKAVNRPVKFLKEIPAEISPNEPKPGKDEVAPPKFVPVRSAPEQIKAMQTDRLHITAFNTGAVPVAVAQAGFHPLYAFADEQGNFTYEMQIIVPANSTINDPAGLRGQTVAFVAMSSNSGGRAPLVLLKEKFGLEPGKDYQFLLKGDHRRSIRELVTGTVPPNFQAACVASDILQQMIATQELDESRYKVIFKSSSFPKATFGVPYNLHPELRKKLIEGFKNFRFENTSLAKKYDREKTVRFAPLVYSKAYADVLDLNARLAKEFGGAP